MNNFKQFQNLGESYLMKLRRNDNLTRKRIKIVKVPKMLQS